MSEFVVVDESADLGKPFVMIRRGCNKDFGMYCPMSHVERPKIYKTYRGAERAAIQEFSWFRKMWDDEIKIAVYTWKDGQLGECIWSREYVEGREK